MPSPSIKPVEVGEVGFVVCVGIGTVGVVGTVVDAGVCA